MPLVTAAWTAAPVADAGRDSDPLGFSSFHESAANVLLPVLSGRTWRATEYVWVLVGLRWASERAGADGAAGEREIWREFERFEKALKVYWYYQGKSFTDGKRAIENRFHTFQGREREGDPLRFTLLSNQRTQGMLGAYGRSLRDLGLVDGLMPTKAGLRSIEDVEFEWCGEFRGLGALSRVFNATSSQIEGSNARTRPTDVVRRIGKLVLSPEVALAGASRAAAMREVASAVHRCKSATPAWSKAARALSGARKEVARLASPLERLAARSHARFWGMLVAEPVKVALDASALTSETWHEAVFGRESMKQLGTAFSEFARACAKKPDESLRVLHRAVWSARSRDDFWFVVVNGKVKPRTSIRQRSAPSDPSGFRWSVCRELIRETRWSP